MIVKIRENYLCVLATLDKRHLFKVKVLHRDADKARWVIFMKFTIIWDLYINILLDNMKRLLITPVMFDKH